MTCQFHRSTFSQTQPVARCKWVPTNGDVQNSLPILIHIYTNVQRQGALPVPEFPRYNSSSQEMESPANPGRFSHLSSRVLRSSINRCQAEVRYYYQRVSVRIYAVYVEVLAAL